jgi:hypothetical protein
MIEQIVKEKIKQRYVLGLIQTSQQCRCMQDQVSVIVFPKIS